LESDDVFEFSSASTVVTGWQEVGSLNIKCMLGKANSMDGVFRKLSAGPFQVADVRCLVYEDAGVYSECGIVFYDDVGGEWTIAAGIPPGSVSISAPFLTIASCQSFH
jgi:hypothetical protein